MIVCEILSCKLVTTVLACVVVSGVDIPATELDHLLVSSRVSLLSDHCRELHGHRRAMYSLTVIDHSFTLTEHEANNGVLPTDDFLRHVVAGKDEHSGHTNHPNTVSPGCQVTPAVETIVSALHRVASRRPTTLTFGLSLGSINGKELGVVALRVVDDPRIVVILRQLCGKVYQ